MELTVVPGHGTSWNEREPYALLRLLSDHRSDLVLQLSGVALEELEPELLDLRGVPFEHDVALEHHAAELVVLDALLEAECCARVPLQVPAFCDFA